MSRLLSGAHPLLTEDVVQKLHAKGMNTILNFLDAEIKTITTTTALTYKDVILIRKHLVNKNSAVLRNGLSYYEELLKKSAVILTGITNFDDLIGGGLITGNHYELCGLPCVGKTQFCLTLCKNVVKQYQQKVYYLDTKRDFSARRLKEMMECEQVSQIEMAEILVKILVKSITSKYDLINALHAIHREIKEGGLQLRLIIIDSLPVLFYDTANTSENNSMLNHLANIIRFLCREHHLVVFGANLLTNWVEGEFGEEANAVEKIGLGKYWLGVPNCRLGLRLGQEGNERKISVLNSCSLAAGGERSLFLSCRGFH